jgi:hypothetical protein
MSIEVHEEIIVNMKNEPGALARILKHIAESGANMIALVAYQMGADGAAHLIADHAQKVKDELDKLKAKYDSHPVLVVRVEDHPGSAAAICHKIAAKGINIEHCYATATKGQAAFVIRTKDHLAAKAAIG